MPSTWPTKPAIAHRDEQLPEDFPQALADAVEDWQFETEADDSGPNTGFGCTPFTAVWMPCARSSNICSRNSIHSVT